MQWVFKKWAWTKGMFHTIGMEIGNTHEELELEPGDRVTLGNRSPSGMYRNIRKALDFPGV